MLGIVRSASVVKLWNRNPIRDAVAAAKSSNSAGPSSVAPLGQAFTSITKRTMATKKAGGSTNNGRDSIGRRLGIKVWVRIFSSMLGISWYPDPLLMLREEDLQ